MDDSPSNPTRRRFLQAAAAAGAASVAGCLRPADGETYVPPTYDGGIPDRWQSIQDIERETSYTGLTAYTKGTVYSDAVVRKGVREKTLGSVDANLVVFSGAQINFEGLGAGFVSPTEVLNNAEDGVLSLVRANGVTDITENENTVLETDRAAAHREYVGTYTVEEQTFKIPLQDTGDVREITLPPADIPVRVFVSVIDPSSREDMLLAAGAYPQESYSTEKRVSLSGDEESGVNVTIEVDLKLTPETYRSRLESLVNAIQLT